MNNKRNYAQLTEKLKPERSVDFDCRAKPGFAGSKVSVETYPEASMALRMSYSERFF